MTTRANRKRVELLKVARRVVAEGGFRALSMQALAEAAGVATGTSYRYFPSKGELCAALVVRVSAREHEVLDLIASGDSAPAERLASMAGTFTRRALRAPRLAYAVIAEPVDPEVEDARLDWRARITARFSDVLTEGMQSGALCCTSPSVFAACATGAMMEAVITVGRDGVSPSEADEVAAQVAAFCAIGGGAPNNTDDKIVHFSQGA